MKILISNILKYTVGLPILIMFTSVELILYIIVFIVFGNESDCILDMIKSTWTPNK